MKGLGLQRFLFIGLVVLLSVFLCGGIALAGFSDVPEDHWAAANIEQMSELGVVGGYKDGTFRPDHFVSQAEAACMAVRVMGWQVSSSDNLPQVSFSVPDWADKEVRLATKHGLLKNNESFSAYSGASRAWVARLVVRMVDKEKEVEEGLLLPNFVDSYKIPDWAVYYVRVAQDNGLITGYEDNSFRPDEEVSRAEMVTLLSRVREQLPDKTTDNGSYPDTRGDLATINGTVVKVYPESNALIIEEETSGSLKTLYSAADNSVSIGGSDLQGIEALQPGDQVEAVIDTSGRLSRVLVNYREGFSLLEGVVYDLELEAGLLTIQSDDNRLSSYRLVDYVEVRAERVRFPSVEDIRVGDKVKLDVENNVVTGIEILETASRLSVTGEVLILSSGKNLINLEVDGRVMAYSLSPNVRVSVPGLDNAFLSDVNEGDTVTAQIESGKVVALEVSGRQVDNTYTATVYAVDTSNRILTLKDRDDKYQVYEVLEEARIDVKGSGDSDAELQDLERDMEVKFRLLDGDIIYVKSDSRMEGIITSLDEEGLLMVLQRDSGVRETYILDDKVDIDSEDKREEIKDLRRGDYVRVLHEDNRVTEIELRSRFIYRVERVREVYDRIEVVDEEGDSHRLYLEDETDLIIPGIAYPGLDDVKVGDLVLVTYLGRDLDTVEVLEPLRGRITAVDEAQEKTTIKCFDGETVSVSFTGGSVLNIDGRKYDSLSKLKIGDRLEVVEDLDGDFIFMVMEEVSGKLALDVDNRDDEVYLEGRYGWECYNLDEEVYLHDADGFVIELDELRAGDEVSLYMLRDIVYELEL
jgi:hypothetical protein